MFYRILPLVSIASLAVLSYAASPPQIEISNAALRVKLYLPDAAEGFYRATRFDWSGVIHSLVYQGHDYYGPWFSQLDPSVRDFTHRDGQIVVGAVSAMTGPVEEFQKPIGYDTAAAGGTFLRVGVGVLRKPDDTNYASFKPYENVDSGKWTVNQKADSAEFAHELNHSSSRYGYVYSKTIRLTPGKPEMVMSHRVAFPIQRFGAEARDYDFRIENAKAGAEMRITGDRPLSSAALWSIRSVLAIEPFLDVVAEPRKDFTWSYTYTYYTLPKANAP